VLQATVLVDPPIGHLHATPHRIHLEVHRQADWVRAARVLHHKEVPLHYLQVVQPHRGRLRPLHLQARVPLSRPCPHLSRSDGLITICSKDPTQFLWDEDGVTAKCPQAPTIEEGGTAGCVVLSHPGLPQRLLLSVRAKDEAGASGHNVSAMRVPLQLYFAVGMFMDIRNKCKPRCKRLNFEPFIYNNRFGLEWWLLA
jgi:hypothetical protein